MHFGEMWGEEGGVGGGGGGLRVVALESIVWSNFPIAKLGQTSVSFHVFV